LKHHIFGFSYDAHPFRFSPVLLFIVQLLLTPVQGTTRSFAERKGDGRHPCAHSHDEGSGSFRNAVIMKCGVVFIRR